MGFTKSELVQFFDELTGLISEENQSEANLLIRGFVLDLRELIDITEYAKWADEEIYRDFAKKLAASRW